MKPFAVDAEAERELREAITHYDAQRPGLGREFRMEFEAAVSRIRLMPEVPAPIDTQGTRKLRLRRFPYTIYYVDLADSLWIAAVAHQRRRPNYWSARQPPAEEGP